MKSQNRWKTEVRARLRSSAPARAFGYIDIIRTIRRAKGLHTVILPIPYGLFRCLLRFYALSSGKPPLTAAQLDALSAGDEFRGVDTGAAFGVVLKPFEDAVREYYCAPRYSAVVLAR